MLTDVAIPTFLPFFLAFAAIDSIIFLFLSTPIAPLYVLIPVAKAVPPVDESVTEFVAENEVAYPAIGNEANVNGDIPICFSFSAKYISVTFIGFNPIPSPMK